jgi:hypothetical protein
MRKVIWALAFVVVGSYLIASTTGETRPGQTKRKSNTSALLANTLCKKDERVIFSCPVKRPGKIVSVCASKNLTSEVGYLQYRFGLPGKIELEFPQDRNGSQRKFQYVHYFRARVDLTEINFDRDGYTYSVFDDYNGEEKPSISRQGVSVNQPGTDLKEMSFVCRTKPRTDYTDLQAVLPTGQE